MSLAVVPTRAFVWLSVVPLVLGALAALQPSLVKSVALLDGALVACAALDALFCLRKQLEVRRVAPDVLSLKRRNAVRLELDSKATRRLHVQVLDDLFDGAVARDLPAAGEIPARGQLTLTYHVEPSVRGAYTLGAHHLRYRSPLGLWQRQIRVPASSLVRVYPDLKQLQAFDLLARDSREYALVRVSRLKGGESEFARLRDQVPDDEHRSIDWKATARRQRLTVREYQIESNQNVLFMLEAGRMMTGIEAGLSRFDHALNASLMLAHVASRTGDRVGVLGFDQNVRVFVAPVGGPSATRRLIQATYDLHPTLVEPDYERAFSYLSARVRSRALVILFSHVIDGTVGATLVRRVNALRGRHLPLVVLFRDTDIEALAEPGSRVAPDIYTKAAAAEILRNQRAVASDMRRAGALVLETDARNLTGKLVSRYLQLKARNLL
jgi:uncharacterized protein (DUF58 family)